MRCPSCGEDNREGASFCDGCGAPLAPARPKCGASLRPEAPFCDKYGASLAETAPPTPTPAPALSPTLPASFASGRYQVRRFLVEGGWKKVYLAHDTKLDSDAAFSLIKTEGLDDEGLTRIRREAQAMGRLRDHPHAGSLTGVEFRDAGRKQLKGIPSRQRVYEVVWRHDG